MTQNQKRSSGKQNLSTNRRGKRKSRDVNEPEKARRVRHRTVIEMIRGNTNKKRPREQSKQWTSNEISFPFMSGYQLVDSPIILEALIEGFQAKLEESRTPLIGFSGKVSYPIGTINLSMTMREPGRLRTILMEFAIVKSHSSYNVILGRTGLRSLEVVASTIYSMIKFPTANGITTMTTKREIHQECRRMEEVQGPTIEGRTIPPRMQASGSEGTISKGKEGSQGQMDKTGEPDVIIQPSPISSKKYTQADEK
nr:reverse transcriptase domain-containing protein [Tanacetum cinerariifolium]